MSFHLDDLDGLNTMHFILRIKFPHLSSLLSSKIKLKFAKPIIPQTEGVSIPELQSKDNEVKKKKRGLGERLKIQLLQFKPE